MANSQKGAKLEHEFHSSYCKSHTLLPGRQLANKQEKNVDKRFLLWHFSDDVRGDIVCVYLRLYDYKTDFKAEMMISFLTRLFVAQ